MNYREFILSRMDSWWRPRIKRMNGGFGYLRNAPEAILFSTEFKAALGWEDGPIEVIVDGKADGEMAEFVMIRRMG
jgi:hypothetical protein